jgi:peptidoglycan hydrolase CwlO-like protein
MYDAAQKNCDELTSQIQGVIAKFDVIKNEISSSSKRMEEYKQEVETKQLEIKLLETQIANFSLLSKKKEAI